MGFMNQRTQLGGLPSCRQRWLGTFCQMGNSMVMFDYQRVLEQYGTKPTILWWYHGRSWQNEINNMCGFLEMAWTPVLIQELHWSLANQWLKAVPFLMSKRRGSHLHSGPFYGEDEWQLWVETVEGGAGSVWRCWQGLYALPAIIHYLRGMGQTDQHLIDRKKTDGLPQMITETVNSWVPRSTSAISIHSS